MLSQNANSKLPASKEDKKDEADHLNSMATEICFHGLGLIPKGSPLAFQLFQTAAAMGNPDACYNLGLYYTRGNEVKKSCKRAAIFFSNLQSKGILRGYITLDFIVIMDMAYKEIAS